MSTRVYWSTTLISLCVTVCLTNPSHAVDYRWAFIFGTGGISDASIKNKDGASFSITCATGGNRKMALELISPLVPKSQTDLQVVVDDESYHFAIVNGHAELEGRLNIGQLSSLVEALKNTKANHFVTELPAFNQEFQFSTLGTGKVLKGLLDACLEQPTQPNAMSPAPRNSYPGEMLGAWGGRAAFQGNDDPKVAARACASYRKDPNSVEGDVLVFKGSEKFSYGGYVDYGDKNISVKQISNDQWEITDRHYHDGEGGGKVGFRNVTYKVTISGTILTLTDKNNVSRYSKCG